MMEEAETTTKAEDGKTFRVLAFDEGIDNSSLETPSTVKRTYRVPTGAVYEYAYTSDTSRMPYAATRKSSSTSADIVPEEMWEGIKKFNNEMAERAESLTGPSPLFDKRVYRDPMEMVLEQTEIAMKVPRTVNMKIYQNCQPPKTYLDVHDSDDNRFDMSAFIDEDTQVRTVRMPNGVIFEYYFKSGSHNPFMRRFGSENSQQIMELTPELTVDVYHWNYIFNSLFLSNNKKDEERESLETIYNREQEKRQREHEELLKREADRQYAEYQRQEYIRNFESQYGATPENTPYDIY